jgi:hypothetical protein
MGQKEFREDLAVYADESDGSDVVHVSIRISVFGEDTDVMRLLHPWSDPRTKTEIEQAAWNAREGWRQKTLDGACMDAVDPTSHANILNGQHLHLGLGCNWPEYDLVFRH